MSGEAAAGDTVGLVLLGEVPESMGVAIAVTTSVWARMVPRRTRPSAIFSLSNELRLLARVFLCDCKREPLRDRLTQNKQYIVWRRELQLGFWESMGNNNNNKSV